MAVAYQSVGTVAYASGTTCTVPKPSGLIAGDLMVAFVHQKDVDTATCTLTGWTVLNTVDMNASTGDYCWTLYKVADAGDVAGSNFVFTLSDTGYVGGAVIRIDGQNTSTPINASAAYENTSNTTGPVFNNTITPSVANCLLLFFRCTGQNVTSSNYAITTSNPTWTESFDFGSALPNDRSMAGAYASRPETSATGDSTCNTNDSDFTTGIIIAIAPVAAAGPANLKSYNTNLKANIKTIDTNPIANVKTLDTNA